jgi:hypothetical protein
VILKLTDLRRSVVRIALFSFASVVMAGCFDSVPLPVSATYLPDRTAPPVSGAEDIPVKVEVKDTRRDQETIGEFHAPLGSRPITTSDDLARVLKSGVESELKDRGFVLEPSGAIVAIDLEKVEVGRYRNAGALLSPAEDGAAAIVAFNVKLKRGDGTVLYSKRISGAVRLPGLEDQTLSSGSQQALNYALARAVRNLMAEPGFMKALLASRPSSGKSAIS